MFRPISAYWQNSKVRQDGALEITRAEIPNTHQDSAKTTRHPTTRPRSVPPTGTSGTSGPAIGLDPWVMGPVNRVFPVVR